MTQRNSESQKRRWAQMTPEERSARMSELATFKWFKTSDKDRRKHAMLMVKAKKNKK